MDSVVEFFTGIANSISTEAAKFDHTTWAILAIMTVVFGYFMLRGNLLR